MSLGLVLSKHLHEHVATILDANRFPPFAETFPDNLSDLVTRWIIVHCRYWHLEDEMAAAGSDSELASLRRESEGLFKKERPRIVEAFDRQMMSLVNEKNIFQDDALTSFLTQALRALPNEGRATHYDDIHTDTLAELVDRMIIIFIRLWYMEGGMKAADQDNSGLRQKADILREEKIPMLREAFDKLIVSILDGRFIYSPQSLKKYRHWEGEV